MVLWIAPQNTLILKLIELRKFGVIYFFLNQFSDEIEPNVICHGVCGGGVCGGVDE